MVIFEHAQKLSISQRKIGFQPPVRNWWKVSDISIATIFVIGLDNDGVLTRDELTFGYNPYDQNDVPILLTSTPIGLAALATALAGAGAFALRRRETRN